MTLWPFTGYVSCQAAALRAAHDATHPSERNVPTGP